MYMMPAHYHCCLYIAVCTQYTHTALYPLYASYPCLSSCTAAQHSTGDGSRCSTYLPSGVQGPWPLLPLLLLLARSIGVHKARGHRCAPKTPNSSMLSLAGVLVLAHSPASHVANLRTDKTNNSEPWLTCSSRDSRVAAAAAAAATAARERRQQRQQQQEGHNRGAERPA